jgi:hypothetical protein
VVPHSELNEDPTIIIVSKISDNSDLSRLISAVRSIDLHPDVGRFHGWETHSQWYLVLLRGNHGLPLLLLYLLQAMANVWMLYLWIIIVEKQGRSRERQKNQDIARTILHNDMLAVPDRDLLSYL